MNQSPLPTQEQKDITEVKAAVAGRTPTEHQRPPDQTYLTFPEWYLVFSPEEFATFSETKTPDRFPFFGHIGQFWQSYSSVYGVIKKKYAFNTGYHVMIMVIGGSTTVEYTLRACYEKTVGRLSKLTSSGLTEEDKFAAIVAREYVDFIKVQPWYEFDFKDRLKRLWKENPATGKNMIRKWERRYILTTDFCVKAVYGWAIKKMTKASYENPLPVTAVVADSAFDADTARIKTISRYDDGSVLMLLPRYDAFKDAILTLARNNINIKEIAGNTESILVTYLVPRTLMPASSDVILFTQPILTQPEVKRIALVIPISELSKVMARYDRPEITLEHVFDF